MRRSSSGLLLLGLLVGCGGSTPEPQPAPTASTRPAAVQSAAAQPAEAASIDTFPVGIYANLNPNPGGQIDLSEIIGKKPVVLGYWIAGNPRSEEMFRELEELALEIGPERLALLGVAVPRPNADAAAIGERIRALGFRSPVLEDLGFEIGTRLHVARVPHITVLDREGRIRLTNGASLRQVISTGLDLEAAIRRTAKTGQLASYGTLGRYFPVKELEGRKCPDFRAPLLADSVEQRWSGMMDAGKLNLLIFWSVDCPHCRHALPEINSWLRQNPEGVNVVSAAKVTSEATKIKTREFCDINGFVFPTLVDDSEITELFNVTTTPTILIIRPDGVIDSALVTADSTFGATIERKIREILGS